MKLDTPYSVIFSFYIYLKFKKYRYDEKHSTWNLRNCPLLLILLNSQALTQACKYRNTDQISPDFIAIDTIYCWDMVNHVSKGERFLLYVAPSGVVKTNWSKMFLIIS